LSPTASTSRSIDHVAVAVAVKDHDHDHGYVWLDAVSTARRAHFAL
jgi:hypothetical protein